MAIVDPKPLSVLDNIDRAVLRQHQLQVHGAYWKEQVSQAEQPSLLDVWRSSLRTGLAQSITHQFMRPNERVDPDFNPFTHIQNHPRLRDDPQIKHFVEADVFDRAQNIDDFNYMLMAAKDFVKEAEVLHKSTWPQYLGVMVAAMAMDPTVYIGYGIAKKALTELALQSFRQLALQSARKVALQSARKATAAGRMLGSISRVSQKAWNSPYTRTPVVVGSYTGAYHQALGVTQPLANPEGIIDDAMAFGAGALIGAVIPWLVKGATVGATAAGTAKTNKQIQTLQGRLGEALVKHHRRTSPGPSVSPEPVSAVREVGRAGEVVEPSAVADPGKAARRLADSDRRIKMARDKGDDAELAWQAWRLKRRADQLNDPQRQQQAADLQSELEGRGLVIDDPIGQPFVDGMRDIDAIAWEPNEALEGVADVLIENYIGKVIRPIVRGTDGKWIKRGQVVIHERLKTKAELASKLEQLRVMQKAGASVDAGEIAAIEKAIAGAPETVAPETVAPAVTDPTIPGAALPGPARVATSMSNIGTVEGALKGTTSVHADEFVDAVIKQFNITHGTNYTARNIADDGALEALRASNADHYHASPDCTNFSKAKTIRTANENDLAIAQSVARNIREVKPPSFSMEQVPAYAGFVKRKGQWVQVDNEATALYKLIVKELDDAGYTHETIVVDAADYGAAQTRPRMILRSVREGKLPPMPAKTKAGDWHVLLKDLIDQEVEAGNFNSPGPDEIVRINRYVSLGKLDSNKPMITMGGSASKGVPYAANAGGPSPTLLASPAQVPRIIIPKPGAKGLEGATFIKVTPRMMARLMGLPDTFKIPGAGPRGGFGAAKQMLGNGVHAKITEQFIQPLVDQSVKARPVAPAPKVGPAPKADPATVLNIKQALDDAGEASLGDRSVRIVPDPHAESQKIGPGEGWAYELTVGGIRQEPVGGSRGGVRGTMNRADAKIRAAQALEARQPGIEPVGPALEVTTTPAAVPREAARLPRELAGAKPRYNIGRDSYSPQFESDIDKALYIVSQKTKSKRDESYMGWLRDNLPDKPDGSRMTDVEIRAAGREVREHIKSRVAGQPTGKVDIPTSQIARPITSRPGPPDISVGADLANTPSENGVLHSFIDEWTEHNDYMAQRLEAPVEDHLTIQILYAEGDETHQMIRELEKLYKKEGGELIKIQHPDINEFQTIMDAKSLIDQAPSLVGEATARDLGYGPGTRAFFKFTMGYATLAGKFTPSGRLAAVSHFASIQNVIRTLLGSGQTIVKGSAQDPFGYIPVTTAEGILGGNMDGIRNISIDGIRKIWTAARRARKAGKSSEPVEWNGRNLDNEKEFHQSIMDFMRHQDAERAQYNPAPLEPVPNSVKEAAEYARTYFRQMRDAAEEVGLLEVGPLKLAEVKAEIKSINDDIDLAAADIVQSGEKKGEIRAPKKLEKLKTKLAKKERQLVGLERAVEAQETWQPQTWLTERIKENRAEWTDKMYQSLFDNDMIVNGKRTTSPNLRPLRMEVIKDLDAAGTDRFNRNLDPAFREKIVKDLQGDSDIVPTPEEIRDAAASEMTISDLKTRVTGDDIEVIYTTRLEEFYRSVVESAYRTLAEDAERHGVTDALIPQNPMMSRLLHIDQHSLSEFLESSIDRAISSYHLRIAGKVAVRKAISQNRYFKNKFIGKGKDQKPIVTGDDLITLLNEERIAIEKFIKRSDNGMTQKERSRVLGELSKMEKRVNNDLRLPMMKIEGRHISDPGTPLYSITRSLANTMHSHQNSTKLGSMILPMMVDTAALMMQAPQIVRAIWRYIPMTIRGLAKIDRPSLEIFGLTSDGLARWRNMYDMDILHVDTKSHNRAVRWAQKLERGSRNISDTTMRLNLAAMATDWNKQVAGDLTVHWLMINSKRLIRANKLISEGMGEAAAFRKVGFSSPKYHPATVNRLGLNLENANLLHTLAYEHGRAMDGIRIKNQMSFNEYMNSNKSFNPSFSEWNLNSPGARGLRDTLGASINDYVNRGLVVTPGAFDKPLWNRNVFVKLINQFQSFSFAFTNQRLRPMAQMPARTQLPFYASYFFIGAMVDASQSAISGRRSLSDTAAMWANPDTMLTMIYAAIEKSGLMGSLARPFSAAIETMIPSVGMPFLSSEQRGSTSRKRSGKGTWYEFLGPSFGSVGMGMEVLDDLVGMNLSERTIGNAWRLMPLQNLIWFRLGYQITGAPIVPQALPEYKERQEKYKEQMKRHLR